MDVPRCDDSENNSSPCCYDRGSGNYYCADNFSIGGLSGAVKQERIYYNTYEYNSRDGVINYVFSRLVLNNYL